MGKAARHPGQRLRLPAFVAAFMVLLCLVTPISGFVHMALVRHVWCAEHGELMHVGEHVRNARTVHAGRAVAPFTNQEAIEAAPGDSARSHDHPHCALLSILQSIAVFKGVAEKLAVVHTVRFDAPQLWSFEQPVVAFPIYLLAPKHSPPQLPPAELI